MERNTENIESCSSSSVQKQDTDVINEDEFLVELIKLETMEYKINKVKIESKMDEDGLSETSQNNERHPLGKLNTQHFDVDSFSADKNLLKDVKLEVMDDYVEVTFANPLEEEDEPDEITVNCSIFKNVESKMDLVEDKERAVQDGAFADTSEQMVPVNIEKYRAQLEDKSLNCAECEQYFVTKRALQRHLESHFDSNVNECIQCAEVLTQSDRFNKISLKCGKCQNKCSLCNSVVGNYSNALKQHMRTHSGARPFACPHCLKTFTRKGNLNSHIRGHTEKRSFACPHCTKTFLKTRSLQLHVKTHYAQRPFACPHCAKTFAQKGTLDVHLKTHINKQPLSCPHCVKTFPTKSSLNLHIREHTGERPFTCPHCVKTFVLKGSLTMHLKSHAAERPFACTHCQKTFLEKRDLTFHIKCHS